MEYEGINNIHLLLASYLFLLVAASSTSQGITLPYMTSNIEEVSGKSFDYIVVGGGASGCPLVATLSEKFSVLLIERGGSPYNDPLITESKNYGLSMVATDEFSSAVQSFVSEEGVSNSRGRVLGGSTAINYGIYSRASDDYIERLGWDKKLVKEAYEWVESKIVTQYQPDELTERQSIVKNSLVEAGVLPFNGFSLEHISGTKVGALIFDRNGSRHSSADLLSYGNLNRITVLLNATVKNLIFLEGKPKVVGVRFIKSSGDGNKVYEAYLKQPIETGSWGDVILSAGALGSPQILMLSGIGPEEHLQHFNISPIVNAPGVGKDIEDNPAYTLLLDTLTNRTTDPYQVAGIAADFQVIIESGTPYTALNETRWEIGAKMACPASKGKLELKNTDPRQNPSVRYNYLTEESDMDQFVKMAYLLQKVTQSNSMKSYLGSLQNENIDLSTVQNIREYCKMNVATFYHYHGGCGIGSVVNKDYKVYGIEGLRVIDGSTLPDAPGTNPMATLLMLGRYQGIKILEETDYSLITCTTEGGAQHLTTSGPW